MAAQTPSTPVASPPDGAQAFGNALSDKGVDNDLATRALYAYRRSQGLTQDLQIVQ